MRPAKFVIFCALVAQIATPQRANAQSAVSDAAINRCTAIADDTSRLRCYENAIQPQRSSAQSQLLGRWRLVHTPNPQQGGKEAISIMRAAELTGSDPDFAGLMLRCGDSDIEVLAILIAPLPPRSHPRILIDGDTFDGSITSPGAAVLLPRSAGDFANGKWQTLRRLNIEVSEGTQHIKGVVDIEGLQGAMQSLAASCAVR